MTSSVKPKSLQGIIFFRIAPFACLILFAIAVVSIYWVSQTLRKEVQERVASSSQHGAQEIESKIASLVSACEAVAANDLVLNGIVDMDHRNSTLRSFFKSLQLPGPKSQRIAMADYKGRLIEATDKSTQNFLEEAWYDEVMAGGQFIGTDGSSLIVAVPVLYANRAEAAIVSKFDLVELVSDQLQGSESGAFVFESKGQVVYSTEPTVVVPAREFQDPKGWLVGTSSLSRLSDFRVRYIESEQKAFAAARQMSLFQLMLFVVLFSGLVAAIRLAARLASQPLHQMLVQVGEIKQAGGLNLRIAQEGPREFQSLAQGFNEMLGRLQSTTVSYEKYRASEERLSFAIQGTNDGLWDWDMVTNEVWYSPRYKAMLGYGEKEFPNLLTSFESHLHPDDVESTWNAVEKHVEGSADYDVEHRLRTKSGGNCWVRARGAVTRDAGGKPIRMSGSMQDISVRKRYQTELKNKQLELEKVLDVLPIALVFTCPDRKIKRVNQAFTEVFGYDDDEILGKSTAELYADPSQFQKQGQERFNSEVKVNLTPYEVEYKRKDLSNFIAESVGTVVFDSLGNVAGMLGLVADISERKAAERDLRINKFAVENASNGVFWIRPDGSFSAVNQQAATYLGYSKDELCKLNVSDIYPAYSAGRWSEHWEETRKHGVLQLEMIHQRKDGSRYDCIDTKHFLSFEGVEVIFATVRDVTAEKEFETALIRSKQLAEESEQRFRALADSAAPLCWVSELDTSFSWLNKRWLDYSGKTLEEQIGFGWVDTVHPKDRANAKSTYLNAFEKRDSFELSYRLRRHDGVYRWHTANATPRIDESGTFVGYVGMIFDSHDAKESREALEASELALKETSESLRATLDLLGTSDGVWDWKINTQETKYTPGFRKILGFEGDDRVAFPDTMEAFNARIHPEEKTGLWAEIEQSLESRVPFAYDFRVRSKGEKYIWVRSRGAASFDRVGKPVHLVGSIFDISAQKDVEFERDRFLATAAELYAAIDLETLKWGKLNAAWSDTLGYEPEKIVKLPMTALHPAEQHEFMHQQFKRLREGKPIRGWVAQAKHKDGSLRYIEWNIDPPNPGESIVYGAGRDVTKVREYLAQIEEKTRELGRLNAQYEQSNSDLAQFAYVASHDLQEPLRAVGGFLQLLQKSYHEQLDDTAKGYIEKAVSGAARMNQLINDLLYYSRVTNATPDLEVVDLNHCVANALETAASGIETSEAKVHVSQLPTINGIGSLLVQLFQNLIGNAIKYRGKDPPVLEIWAESNSKEVVILVKDNGIGIPEAYQDQVFSLFKRLHHRKDYPGTGIGLAICQRVAQRHGGSISVKSNESKGSCFSVKLPKKQS